MQRLKKGRVIGTEGGRGDRDGGGKKGEFKRKGETMTKA